MKFNCETETKKSLKRHSNKTNKQAVTHTHFTHWNKQKNKKNHGIKTKDKNNFKRLRDQKLHVKAIEC